MSRDSLSSKLSGAILEAMWPEAPQAHVRKGACFALVPVVEAHARVTVRTAHALPVPIQRYLSCAHSRTRAAMHKTAYNLPKIDCNKDIQKQFKIASLHPFPMEIIPQNTDMCKVAYFDIVRAKATKAEWVFECVQPAVSMFMSYAKFAPAPE